ncbi:hypothetical protein [Devriesea agamarum]|uniref:hypothetical protein n=1 Tax=Devriesea agamarum TaxID=472569 RepID=UPI00071DBC90|nr:hypothetical protein [Devriesea agamarum]
MIIFPDPVAIVISYLSQHLDAQYSQDPRPDDFRGLYISVVDSGGTLYEQVFDDVRITVECSHEDADAASLAARTVDALLREWGAQEGRWLNVMSRPRYTPDPDLRIPIFQLTHTLRFRGQEVPTP